jgi:hypothetical protein
MVARSSVQGVKTQFKDKAAAGTNNKPRRHLIIAGTGRAGTSFLVRYFTGLGLDTIVTREGEAAFWDVEANAGLEHVGLNLEGDDLPYVVKSPWIAEYIDNILEEKRVIIDAFIVPIRDLVEAATSRSVLEHRAIHQNNPWMAERLDRSWETFGVTPGGVIYSLNPLDQARLLAVQFHQLVLKVSESGIPLVFPVFPRIATDWEYLHRCMEPILPAHITKDISRSAHVRVADASKVRVTREISNRKQSNVVHRPELFMGPQYPSSDEIDSIALRREIVRIREELESRSAQLDIKHQGEMEHQREIFEGTIQQLQIELESKSLKKRIRRLLRIFGRQNPRNE